MPPSVSIHNKKALSAFGDKASHHIRVLMTEHRVRYEDVVDSLAGMGIDYSASNLRNKISQNALSAALFFALVHAITGKDTVSVTFAKKD